MVACIVVHLTATVQQRLFAEGRDYAATQSIVGQPVDRAATRQSTVGRPV